MTSEGNQLLLPGFDGAATPPLSKTRFIGGLQCLKRLYLESFHRELIPPVRSAQQALFDSGNTVGALARGLFHGGLLINLFAHNRAIARTRAALSNDFVTSIYEAAFTFDDIRTRVDILRRIDSNAYTLGEVKSTTRVKREHIPDAAIQVYVAEGSGIEIRNIYLIHLDNTYVFKGGEYELDRLFHQEDITSKVRSYMAKSLPSDLKRMRDTLAKDDVPAIDIGKHCTRPYECPFYAYCRQGLPAHHVEQLPGARADLLAALAAAGVNDISDIFSGFPGLTRIQSRVRNSVANSEPFVGGKLGAILSEPEYPLRFLDFETFSPGLPYYPGTRPYQVIPFQWSMHVKHANDGVGHLEFLHVGTSDPRPRFITSLIDAAGTSGAIVTYSAYEATRLKQLAVEFPEYGDSLFALVDRMFDLHKVLRANYYHPEFHGSFSLKAVLPILVPELGYEDLEISDGSVASVAFAQMIDPNDKKSDKDRIRFALLDYCRRDTEAMVEIFDRLGSVGL